MGAAVWSGRDPSVDGVVRWVTRFAAVVSSNVCGSLVQTPQVAELARNPLWFFFLCLSSRSFVSRVRCCPCTGPFFCFFVFFGFVCGLGWCRRPTFCRGGWSGRVIRWGCPTLAGWSRRGPCCSVVGSGHFSFVFPFSGCFSCLFAFSPCLLLLPRAFQRFGLFGSDSPHFAAAAGPEGSLIQTPRVAELAGPDGIPCCFCFFFCGWCLSSRSFVCRVRCCPWTGRSCLFFFFCFVCGLVWSRRPTFCRGGWSGRVLRWGCPSWAGWSRRGPMGSAVWSGRDPSVDGVKCRCASSKCTEEVRALEPEHESSSATEHLWSCGYDVSLTR